MALQVYTASLLKEGLVAYLCMDENDTYWSTDVKKAKAVEENAIAPLKLAAERSEAENIVIAPYVIDVILSDSGIVPATKREEIRAYGPTIIMPIQQSASESTTNRHAA